MMSTPTTTDLAPVTSSRDLKLELPITFDYECRYLTLENGMCALLVHDPTAEKAGVGVGVAAGSYHNPSDTEGLAHFLEHMLFLGTEKYPDEGGYADFISKNGGSRNAYTAVTNTIYYFSVKWDKLSEGLDRLAQFFVAPLFTESATDREIHAIDNEFNRAKEAPVWKAHVLSSVFATPDNPARKFTIGNLATLGSIPTGELRSRLIAFYKAYYLPAAMKVTVVSRHPLDELETLFRTAFAPVPKAPAGVEPKGITVEREALQQSQQQQRAWLTKGMEVHAYLEPGKHYAVLQWEEGRGLDYYRKNPGAYITHLMGHESEGSVALYLKRKGIAHSLTCGYENGPRYSTISCKIVFTEEGWPRREEALAAVFEYIGMMRRAGPQEWVFREVSNSSKAIFLCSSKGKQEDIASTFASSNKQTNKKKQQNITSQHTHTHT